MMTSAALLRALVVWWWVVLLGLGATVGAAAAARAVDGVYWTRATVVMLPSAGPAPGNVLEGYSDTLISFAGAVERKVNDAARIPHLSSSSATLYGAGVREGASVTLPDDGGQWESDFNRAVLVVEVVGPTQVEVERHLRTVVRDIDGSVAALQRDSGVPEDSRITTTLSPEAPSVTYVGTSDGRAAVGVVLLGVAATCGAVIVIEQWHTRARGDQRQVMQHA